VAPLTWIILGLIAGLLAQFITKESSGRHGCTGILLTIVIGIIGAAIGGFIGTQLGWGKVDELDLRSIALAVLGAVLLLLVLGAIRRR
jgi:uncharacterized membrane protein YeaQ/YmgE (transglycosylase-associated protein family)